MKKIFVIITAFLFIFVGCSKEETETTNGDDNGSNVETIEDGNVTNALEAFKAGDMEKFYSYFTEDVSDAFEAYNDVAPEVRAEVANIEYKVKSVDLGKNEGEVEVEITSIYMPAALGKSIDIMMQEAAFISGDSTDEEIIEQQQKMDKLLLELMQEPGAETKTETITIDVKNVGGEWKLEPSEPLFLALSGYYVENN